jgi:6-phosphogluconolactonase
MSNANTVRSPRVQIFPEAETLARAAAEEIALALESAIRKRGSAIFVLTGGNTPKPVYETLSSSPYRERVDWERIDFFWGDERCVPPDHPESNYGMARQTLLSRIAVPESRIHRILGELEDGEKAALRYEAEIRRAAGSVAVPSFDLVLLGMGQDGHTASLFPGTVWDEDRLVVAVSVPWLANTRISMTPRILNAASRVIFLTAGAAKAPALAKVLEDPTNDYPAKKIRPTAGSLTWMVDEPAASLLSPGRLLASSRLRGEDR